MRVLGAGLRLSHAATRRAAYRALPGLAAATRSRCAVQYVTLRGYATPHPVGDKVGEKPGAPLDKPGAPAGTDSPHAGASAAEVAKAGTKEVAKPGKEVAKPGKETKLTLWQKVKHEAKHYWEGTKLLGYEIRVSSKLALKLASGRTLSRREDRQLKRTVQDIVRIVPFSVFVLVPFAELLLPIALKIFPNMLPSTYETSSARTNKTKKLGDTRSRVGVYLRETMQQSKKMVVPEFRSEEQKVEFERFFQQLRDGAKPSKTLILSVARMFRDDMLLDNLSRPQLAGMAKYMNIHSFGTSTILRYQIRHKMRMIKQDDRVIEYEGVDSLNATELHNAAQSRGFKTIGVSTGRLREDLSNWLQLRLHDRVPSTFLILASAYTYGGHDMESVYDGILNVLSSLPPEVYHETELELQSDQATNAQRLEVLKEQDDLIREENKEEQESGHVVQVRDTLNVDDDERVPQPTTVSEADVKADQAWYEEADKRAQQTPPPQPTDSEAVAKADQELYAEADKRAQQTPPPQPTDSEAVAKADQELYAEADKSAHQTPPPQPTDSEAVAKADQELYAEADNKAAAHAQETASANAPKDQDASAEGGKAEKK